MRTAVQLRTTAPTLAGIPFGSSDTTVLGARGPIAVFDPGRIVGYQVEHGRTQRLYVFRTAAGPGPDLSDVPGVHPAVNLLMLVRHRTAARRVGKVFAALSTTGHVPDAIPDAFWIRLAGLVTRRRPPSSAALEQLLARHAPGSGPSSTPHHRHSDLRPLRGGDTPHVQLHAE